MAEEKMVTVNLRRSVGQRMPGTSGAPRLYGPGLTEVPQSLQKALGLKVVKRSSAQKQAQQSTDTDPYKDFLLADFEAEAERRGLEVARTDGDTDKSPRVEDYRAALEADDAGRK